jgi:7-carboxy-7-deazaguanine synthase
MNINEIFYSLQGEGKFSGLPTIFIRTTGCNLRCSYCDTTYAYENGNTYSIDDILKKIQNYHCNTVCVTGGEPLIQKETEPLIEHLIDNGYHCSIETNGSKNIVSLTKKESLCISLDIKCPSSSMKQHMQLDNINLLRPQDQIKFVIATKKDFDYAKQIIQRFQPTCSVYFQPVWGSSTTKLADLILQENLSVHLGLQLHKIIWGKETHR